MPGSFFGLNIATSALLAQQAAINVTGHNIANANNPHFRRQQAVVTPMAAYPFLGQGAGAGQLGSGVQVATIRRIEDRFLEDQVRAATSQLGRWETNKQALDQVGVIIGEPSGNGLSNDMDRFWNAWQDLSLHPDNLAARNNVIEAGSAVAGTMNRLHQQIRDVRAFQNDSVKEKVGMLNQLAVELANVNDQVQRTRGSGDTPNDLMDQRDQILTQMSRLADVQVYGDGGTSDVITINGHTMVQGNRSMALEFGQDASGKAVITWTNDGSEAQLTGGELGGMLKLQREVLPEYLASLNTVADGLIRRVNELHSAGHGLDGVTGRAFFTGTSAGDIKVNATVAAHPEWVAASGSGAPGDASVALAIAKVKNEAVVAGSTIGDAYRTLVSKTASDASSTEHRMEAQARLYEQLSLQQQSVSGVSLDEEMANLVKFQQAYNASARIFTAMDEMLEIVVQRLGVAGR